MTGAQVRGPTYLRDKKKVLADDPLFALAAVDLLEMEAPTFHIARFLPSLKCTFASTCCCTRRIPASFRPGVDQTEAPTT